MLTRLPSSAQAFVDVAVHWSRENKQMSVTFLDMVMTALNREVRPAPPALRAWARTAPSPLLTHPRPAPPQYTGHQEYRPVMRSLSALLRIQGGPRRGGTPLARHRSPDRSRIRGDPVADSLQPARVNHAFAKVGRSSVRAARAWSARGSAALQVVKMVDTVVQRSGNDDRFLFFMTKYLLLIASQEKVP